MTHNSIAYYEAKLQEGRNLEEARHNRESEEATRRAQAITKAYNDFYLKIADFREHEQQRHNMAVERQNNLSNYLSSLQIANESRRIQETERHNKTLESNDLLSTLLGDQRTKERNDEAARHNLAMEKQTASEFEWKKKTDLVNAAFRGIDSFSNAVGSAFRGMDSITRLINVVTGN